MRSLIGHRLQPSGGLALVETSARSVTVRIQLAVRLSSARRRPLVHLTVGRRLAAAWSPGRCSSDRCAIQRRPMTLKAMMLAGNRVASSDVAVHASLATTSERAGLHRPRDSSEAVKTSYLSWTRPGSMRPDELSGSVVGSSSPASQSVWVRGLAWTVRMTSRGAELVAEMQAQLDVRRTRTDARGLHRAGAWRSCSCALSHARRNAAVVRGHVRDDRILSVSETVPVAGKVASAPGRCMV